MCEWTSCAAQKATEDPKTVACTTPLHGWIALEPVRVLNQQKPSTTKLRERGHEVLIKP